MKNYSLSFEDERFDIDIVPNKNNLFYELNEDNASLFILVPFGDTSEDALKILYPKNAYNIQQSDLIRTLFMKFILFSLIAMVLSLLAAFYTLKPIRSALRLLEDFIKDIIHDLNTPITSILINLKMIDGNNEELDSIAHAAKNITMLHQNLDCYLREVQEHKETFLLEEVINGQVDFFAPLYDYLTWEIEVDKRLLTTDKNAFSRIIYNLVSNACKYNTSNGHIKISILNDTLCIVNNSYGVKQPEKLFERFYKEGERGLGIGLHIVDKLCTALSIEKKLEVHDSMVMVSLFLSKVTSK